MVTSEAKRAYMRAYAKAYRRANIEKLTAYREANKEKLIATAKAYRRANIEKLTAYREANKEKMNAYNKEYYQVNKEKLTAYREANKEKLTAYRKANKEQRDAYMKSYAQTNPGKMSAKTAKRRAAKIQRTPNWLTVDDYHAIRTLYETAAALTKSTGIEHHVDHVIPLQGRTVSGFHCPNNLQILTQSENCSKNNKFTGDE
jgi:5-methylcytosine-specific restriction endonuclease McrA